MPPRVDHNPWSEALTLLRAAIDDYSYKNWFAQTRYESYDGGKLRVGVPSQFFADWLRDHYLDTVRNSARKILPDLQQVEFVVAPDDIPRHVPDEMAPAKKPKAPPAPRHGRGFNPRYTFDSFVIGACNRFAHAASRAVADSPGRAYNPLFLYGGTGLGKTHLMQAIGHHLVEQGRNQTCTFISSEHFTNQLIQSIAEKSTHHFRAKYRKVDVLLIDDIHFISGKEATQEEFFHTFNALFDMHKQIVISSDRSPKEIKGIEDRLVSRFEWGLVTDMQPPDLETRVAILQNRARQDGLLAPPDILRYIATYITNNIRELEGALITVLAYCRMSGEKLSLPMVEEVLKDLIGAETIKPVTIERVQRVVAEHFDVRIADLRGRSRQRQVVYPRQLAMYLCKELVPSLSLNDVAEAFGGKDHTTVLYSCKKVAGESKENSALRQTIEQLTKAIRA